MKTKALFGVYLQNSKMPMALFIREDWAIDWQRRMQKKNSSALLYVRPTTFENCAKYSAETEQTP